MAPPDYRQGFRTLHGEVEDAALPISGTLPPWLHGTLVRNGPARFEAGAQRMRHWFDGLAMLHRFTLAARRVSYANKYVRSPAYAYIAAHQRLGYPEFATDPCRSIFKRLTTRFWPEFGHNTSVNVTRLADRFLAWTETPLPIEFDPYTLDTLGVHRFDDQLDTIANSPHPHLDPTTGDAINAGVAFSWTSTYKVYRIAGDGGRRQIIAELPVAEPAYMHSFSLTSSFIVLTEYPLVVNPLQMLLRGRPYAENLVWKPERPTRFLVIRQCDGELLGQYEAPPFFSFHHVNAFERDGEICVDLLAYPDATIIRALYLDVLHGGPGATLRQPRTELRRYRLRPGSATAELDVLSREPLELPRINYDRHHTHDYRFVYGVSVQDRDAADWFDRLAKVDVRTGTTQHWHAAGCYPGEPVFVPAPGARDEDDGVLLSVVLDSTQGCSFLLVLDARSMEECARAEAPHMIPFGFHGSYFSDVG
ncbi:MAG TPA: carotenoid oxygenase family protein [Herpetosiphonaceae bacterium]|nr:carotenoid oxygenase family protein [Herpetosiphonaceae bacterium]